MSNSIAYLTSRSNFLQVSPDVPITKQRNPEKFDEPDVFEGAFLPLVQAQHATDQHGSANKKELVADLIIKAKQVEYLINSLPEPEPEEEQAKRLAALEEEMQVANAEYIRAVHRA
ncbi:hypothetical protein DXG03_007993, partial [Asterophora parasitica]